MEIIRTIALYAEAKKVLFLLIGGHALNFHGLSRQTGDIDLLVKVEDKTWWTELLNRLRYSASQDDNRFARFRSANLGDWPIDLMFVDNSTFEKLHASSSKGGVSIGEVQVVSAEHLVTLKLHALKHYQEHRYAKDYNDLLWLLRTKKARFSETELKELCKKYATVEIYSKLESDLKK